MPDDIEPKQGSYFEAMKAASDALQAKDAENTTLREALARLKAFNQGVYDNDNLTPGQRNSAKLCIDIIDAALGER